MMSRISRAAVLSLSLSLSAGCHRARPEFLAHQPDPSSERTITQGKVVGFAEQDGALAWLGLPFAEPPVGPLRWRAPVPKKPWEGTFQAVRFGRSCAQLVTPIGGRDDDKRGRFLGSEDCLTLNVFAPRAAVPGKDKLPVMVWIHGGGNKIGASSSYSMAGNLAARHGVVVVSTNYRLGVMGWFRHPSLVAPGDAAEDRSGNYGTLDQVLALKWVRDNAAAFGGDPGNVTIFGESAGGIDVLSLVTSPAAKGLFHRAISESGLPASTTVKAAEDFTSGLLPTLLARDGRARDRDQAKAVAQGMSAGEVAAYLRGKTADELIEPLDPGVFGMYDSPNLFRDGAVLPEQPFLELVADAGRYNAVPLLLGTNRDEMKLFMAADPAFVSRWLGLWPHIKDRTRYDRTAGYVSGLWKAVGADWPASVMRRAQGPTVYAYRFDWDEEPSKLGVDVSALLGACHAMEISFVFDNTSQEAFGVPDGGPAWEGYRTLASAMSGYWVQFAKTGAPGRGADGTLPEWKPWSDDGPQADRFMVLDSPGGGGLRMSSEAVTVEGLTAKLEREPAFDGAPRERCRAYARMVKALELISGKPGDEDYARFAGGACRGFPMGSFLADGK
ncbi:MAG TPA: carboxylesterase family protein [Myxococcaceae bacterium]|nr:carboxylesterase family protein [Myxococcaceae bacterium]